MPTHSSVHTLIDEQGAGVASSRTLPTPSPQLSTQSPASATTAEQATSAPQTPTHQTMDAGAGIWISAAEIARLPKKGSGWKQVKSVADGDLGTPSIADGNSKHDVRTLAVALVSSRLQDSSYRQKAIDAIVSAIGTEKGGSSLALARNIVSYVAAADVVGLSGDQGNRFRTWLQSLPTKQMSDGNTLVSQHELRPNNHGTHAGAARIAIARYLGDSATLEQGARIFKGWLGDRSAWGRFRFGDLSWQCDPAHPVPVNLVGCEKDGHSIDGVLPDDQRRSGGFAWPPPKENYVYEALQGAIVQAELLRRAGYAAWEWQDRALLRAFTWLQKAAAYPATGDDEWQPWLANARYRAGLPATSPARHGKNMAWTDWTHRS